MNRIALGLFLFLFSFSFASASESYDVDFSEVSTQAIFVYDGDEIRFSLLGGDHVIIIEDVGSSSIKVDIWPFVDRQNILTPILIFFYYIFRNGFWSDTEKKTEEHVHHSFEKIDSSEELKEEPS